MIRVSQKEDYTQRTLRMLADAGIALTPREKSSVEIADFGLSRLSDIGLQLITYVNTPRCCAKEMVLFAHQTCPEHRHPDGDGQKGKEETFRCRAGEVYLYVPGAPTQPIQARLPEGRETYFTVMREIVLRPGEQYTLNADTLHWFQAGPQGAIISEFSTQSRDELDIFTDPALQRVTVVEG
ncbi:MAG: D-lyxose/D-mannose family sugar isomerase [Eubacteriales bacterium]|nr:D-lyxose/D-mannose family sugar isomerase [Eubacteriales bacterium]